MAATLCFIVLFLAGVAGSYFAGLYVSRSGLGPSRAPADSRPAGLATDANIGQQTAVDPVASDKAVGGAAQSGLADEQPADGDREKEADEREFCESRKFS